MSEYLFFFCPAVLNRESELEMKKGEVVQARREIEVNRCTHSKNGTIYLSGYGVRVHLSRSMCFFPLVSQDAARSAEERIAQLEQELQMARSKSCTCTIS